MSTEKKTEVMSQRLTQALGQATQVLGNTPGETYSPRISRLGSKIQGTKGSYELVEDLTGRGGEATLYICRPLDQPSRRLVAKVYALQARVFDSRRRQKLIEFLTGINPRTSSIMPLLDHGIVDDAFFDILPFYPEGDLGARGKFTYQQLKDLVVPAVNAALRDIHSGGFIHRDIKPGNLFLDGGRVIIGDFGIASLYETESDVAYTRYMGGTPGYVSAEVGQGIAHIKSDYFALGITIASLYKGSDIWKGMSDQSIHRCLVKKELPIDIPDEDKRLRELIRGLIVSDVDRRFGYEDVTKWCRGDAVAIRDGGYVFADNEPIDDPEVLADKFIDNWDKGIQHLYHPSGPVQEFFKSSNQELAVRVSDIVSKEGKDNKDLGLYKFICLLNSKVFVAWRGLDYDSLIDIASSQYRFLPREYKDIADLISSKAISWRFGQVKSPTEQERQLLAEVRKVETWVDQGARQLAYHLFMYRFLPQNMERTYPYGQQTYSSLAALFKAINRTPQGLHSACDRLTRDERFLAFAIQSGFEATAKRLYSHRSSSLRLRLQYIFSLFEEATEDKALVRESYLRFGPHAHLYWLKNNLPLYVFRGDEATKLRQDMAGIKLNKSMTLLEIDKAMLELENLKNQLMLLFKENIFLAMAGVGWGPDSEGVSVRSSDGYFLAEYLGREAPAGFARGLGTLEPLEQGQVVVRYPGAPAKPVGKGVGQ